jgi:hypothetical protein
VHVGHADRDPVVMVDRLRTPLLVVALVLIALVVLIEMGTLILDTGSQPPGYGITFMAFIDATLLVTVALVVLSLVIGRNLEGRIQGVITLIYSIVVIIVGIIGIFAVFQLLLFMIALLLSVPFGTIAYLALFGNFDRGGASVILSLVMLLKIAFVVFLVLAQQRFLQAKGLVVLIVLSLVANVIVSFLQGLPPGVLVSITDAIAAIILGIVGVIFAIVLLVFAVVAIVKSAAVTKNLVA